MVQFALLETGEAILAASFMMALIGKSKKHDQHFLWRNKDISLASSSGLLFHNLFFNVVYPSRLKFHLWKSEGEMDIQIGELPATPPPEAYATWDSPNIAQGTVKELEGLDLKLRPTVHQIAFYGVPGKPASANFDVILEQEIERFPRLYDVGIQILVISIPLIIASFFS